MKRIFSGLLSLLILASCVQTDDFDLPELQGEELTISGDTTNIAAVKSLFNFETGEMYYFRETGLYVPGYVVSSDEGGNFYKELILQDKPASPTAGIQLLVDDNSLYETYNFGRKIYIKLDGLILGYNNGVLQLGKQNRGDVVAIPGALVDEHIIRTAEVAEVKPLDLEVTEIKETHKNLFVKLNNVQFNRNLIRANNRFTFAGDASIDQYDGERMLESCETGATTILSTSTYSGFKSLLLPQGSGSIEGVLTRNFYDDYFVLSVNSPAALQMNNGRCDPEYLDCGSTSEEGSIVLFEENFTNITTPARILATGWKNINVNGGAKLFEPGNSNSNRHLRISAYNTQETPLEVWLVSPAIDLGKTTGEVLSFDLKSGYDNSTILRVYATTNFTGNVATTNWMLLDARIPVGPSGGYIDFYKTSNIDVSCLEGELHFAFRYLGGAPDKTTTYDLDNVRVTGF
ncbi:DUF5689 domain-containing protein [Salegentibacter chungangensis]|uniref:DUF5689 domain-containing protein n=1 Tax=Salegentibacter chungangensis TaxID=1335724 RepID=A0ABW3NNI7_9FLAO